MSKIKNARSRIAQCMAVPPVLRTVDAGSVPFAIICGSDYGFRGKDRSMQTPTPPSAPPASLLRADAFLSPLEIEAAVTRALEEDLGRAGDITSIATIPEDLDGRAALVAREAGVIAGLPLV